MNDRYLFKAKRLDNEKWEIGSLIALPNGEYEITNKCQNPPDSDPIWKKCVITHKVDKKTVCQCTGLKDKIGNLIWDNDIVFVTDDDGNSGQIDTGIGRIDFLEGLWYISGRVQNSLYDIDKCFQIEVIGNSFDNPELLRQSDE